MNRVVAALVGLGLVIAVSYALIRLPSLDLEIGAAVDTVYIRDAKRDTIRDTIKVYLPRAAEAKAESDRLDSAVVIASDSTVVITDTVIAVPPLVVADLRALRLTVATQDTLLRWWERKSAADSLAIVARDRLIALQKPPRCGRRCGFILGAASVAGVVYLVK